MTDHGVPSEPSAESEQFIHLNDAGPSQASSEAESGRQYYDDFLSKVLEGALTRKSAIEQRGITVVTTAGTLVTAVFAIVSFVLAHTGTGILNPHHIIRGSIDGSALLFVFAGILGLLINIPVPYGDPDPSDLDNLLLPEDVAEQPENTKPSGPNDDEHDQVVAAFQALGLGATDDEIQQWLQTREINVELSHIRNIRSIGPGLAAASIPPFLADTANVAAYKIAATRVNLVRKARRWNSVKAQLLFWAVVSEVIAIAFLAWGIHKLLI